MFLKPHFGALSAVLAPFLLSGALSAPVRVSHFCMPFVSGLWHLVGGQVAGTQSIFSLSEALPITDHSCLPRILLSFPWLLLRKDQG